MALPSQHLNGISLCTGGGGLDLGLELALPAARSVVMVEREAFSVAHLVAAIEQGLLAPAALWSDVRTFDGRPWRGVVDFLIGGIPCQPHSLAGKKRGSLDERDLWSPTRRIIVQARPWFGLIENVRGMLSAGADEVAGAERVLRDLRKLGYAVECGLFTAAEVGASHLRPRLFILFVADPGCAKRRQGDVGGCEPDWSASGRQQSAGRTSEPGAHVADTERDGWGQGNVRTGVRGRAAQPDAGGNGLVADAGSQGRQGRSANQAAGQGRQGRSAQRGGSALADASGIGDDEQAGVGDAGPGSWQRPAGGHGGALVDAEVFGRREGRAKPAIRGWRSAAGGPGQPLADADLTELRGESPAGQQQVDERDLAPGLFPPGPSEFDGWRQVLERSPGLEPSLRRMADGVAAELGSRVDELRMLGNGVVSLEGAYAFRTLVTRLARTGHAGAVELARLMGADQ